MSARATFARNWREYLKEAVELFTFMVFAGGCTALFDYPGSPVREAIPSDAMRRLVIGIVMTLVTAGLIYSPWGQRTGAHMNPAVTLTFLQLGRIGGWDAAFYILFQFGGGLLATPFLFALIGAPFAHSEVRFGTTQPGPAGELVAFAAEFVIAFALACILFSTLASPRWKRWTGLFVALAIGLFIAVESPLSGMSMNPARSVGAAVTSGQWSGIWLYFAAPLSAMWLAAETFRRRQSAAALPHYPVVAP